MRGIICLEMAAVYSALGANGKNVGNIGSLLSVHRNESSRLNVNVGVLGADGMAIGASAHRDEDAVEPLRGRCAFALEMHHEIFAPCFDLGDLTLQEDVFVALGHPCMQRFDDIRITLCNEPVQHLDNGDLGTQGVIDGGHLKTNDPSTDDQEPRRDVFELQCRG